MGKFAAARIGAVRFIERALPVLPIIGGRHFQAGSPSIVSILGRFGRLVREQLHAVFIAGIRTREGNGRRSAADSTNNQNRGWIFAQIQVAWRRVATHTSCSKQAFSGFS
ncbi:hypothetical protein NicSoilB11_17740 [Arthrobacter sp. NicSoilB11]|nr:hypothetical protein NicSoilB11_17740 [Arthrobacter sp. NicSoilB11]